MKDKNIKSVVKYSGYSPLVKVEDKLNKNGHLFAAQLSGGYCLFQYAGYVSIYLENGKTEVFHYTIFYERIFQEIPQNFDFLQGEKFFYKSSYFSIKIFEYLKGINGKFPEETFAYPRKTILNDINEDRRYYDLGIQKLPTTLAPQRYFRGFEWNCYSNKIRLYFWDKYCGELLECKQETPEYLSYSPEDGGLEATLKTMEQGFTLESWNTECMRQWAEQYYAEHPYSRPTNETYDELKINLPTVSLREMYHDDTEKLQAISQIETALVAFADRLVDEGKPTSGKAKKLTKELVLTLNKIDNEAEFIETMEREELYEYIAKLLAKLKKPEAIELIDEYREW